MRRLLFGFLTAALSWAEVSGVVTNQTTGKPQAGATVTLYKLGSAGMESVVSVKSGADGKFTMGETPQGPHLIQTAFDGVTYNHMLPPGSKPAGLALTVYNSSAKQPAEVKAATHVIFLEPGSDALNVSESVLYQNAGKVSFNNPNGGTFRFYLPAGAGGKAKVMATAPQGMPVERAVEKTNTPGVFKIDFPIKPGETRFDVTYALPTPTSFATRLEESAGPTRVVAPQGVTLTSDKLKLLGQEPQTQASIFEASAGDLAIAIQGTGSLQGPGGGSGGEDEEGGEGLKQIRPRLYDRFYIILGLAFFMLLLGFLLLYRKGEVASVAVAAAAAGPRPNIQKPKRKA